MQRRVKILQHYSRFLSRLSEQIRYTGAPIYELVTELFPCSPQVNPNDPDMREKWKTCINDKEGLCEDDRLLLKGFAEGIGRADVEGEVRFCDDYREALEEQLSSARETMKTKGKVCLAMGVCGGLLAALLFW